MPGCSQWTCPFTVPGKDMHVPAHGHVAVLMHTALRRQVPLSEGRLETDGTLQCAYHGWRFNAEGKCTTIPQCHLDDQTLEQQHDKAVRQSRACVASYPVQVWLQFSFLLVRPVPTLKSYDPDNSKDILATLLQSPGAMPSVSF